MKISKVLILSILLLLLTTSVAQAKTYALEAQNPYDDNGCGLGNRPSTAYTNMLEYWLQQAGFSAYVKWYDWHAWESDLTYSANRVNPATYFVWAGHSLAYDWNGTNPYGEAGIHFYNDNSTYIRHESGNHFDDQSLARWLEIKWGYGSMKWASTYSCSFLKTGGYSGNLDSILRMFNGLHVMTGYASTMYMYGDEGGTYGYYLQQGYALKDAWVNSGYAWQYRNLSGVAAAWASADSVNGDTIYSNSSDPSPYLNGTQPYHRYFIYVS